MSWEIVIIIVAGVAIAAANGSNDVSKGIATLIGAGIANYKRALSWGTLFTALGAVTGAVLATALVETFGGNLLGESAIPTLPVALATILGAAGWVIFATRTGLPVSTTHAIVGSLVGVALVAFGTGGLAWNTLIWKVATPLLLSPLVSLALTILIRKVWDRRRAHGLADADCICVHATEPVTASGNAYAIVEGQQRLIVDTCKVHGQPQTASGVFVSIDRLHWLTAGLTSFARGMNDAPKLAGLMLAASVLAPVDAISTPAAFFTIAVAMTAGAIFAGRRVAKVLAEDVTVMGHREGFVANLVTAGLVSSGAILGLPMSTTHVSGTAIMGVGAAGAKGDLRADTVRKLITAWVITLPGAALIGIAVLFLLQAILPAMG